MSLHLIKRLMVVLAAFAILTGAMVSPVRAVAVQAGVTAATSGNDDCLAMKMHLPCPVSKSGPCKMTASDCAKLMLGFDSLPGPAAHAAASPGYIVISYDDTSAVFRGRMAEPALFPPRAA